MWDLQKRPRARLQKAFKQLLPASNTGITWRASLLSRALGKAQRCPSREQLKVGSPGTWARAPVGVAESLHSFPRIPQPFCSPGLYLLPAASFQGTSPFPLLCTAPSCLSSRIDKPFSKCVLGMFGSLLDAFRRSTHLLLSPKLY